MTSSQKIRWRPAAVIVLLDIIFVAWTWLSQAVMRQQQVLNTFYSQGVTVLLLLVWLLFFSKLIWKKRMAFLATFIFALLLFTSLFRFKEFSGDIAPIFEVRWKSESQQTSNRGPTPEITEEPSQLNSPNAPNYHYPQFLGPDRNGKIKGIKLNRDWENNPPKLIWRQPIGEGWSSFAIVGKHAITQEQDGEYELVVSYDLTTGRVNWRHRDKTRYATVLAGVGPRATPTIDKDRVYSLGATGVLNCLLLSTGEPVWSKNILKENDAAAKSWGQSCSPFVLDSLVIVSAGGIRQRSLVSYHKLTGDPVWSSGDDPAGYSSPMSAELGGIQQVLIFNKGHVVAHAPVDGRVLWKYPWPKNTEEVAQPVILPHNRVLITTGYGIGSKLLEINPTENGGLSPTLLWENNRLKAKFTNVVYHDGYIYGLDDGILVCLDSTDGKRMWKRGRFGHGQILLADDLLIIQAESGEVALVAASPDSFQELSRFPAIEGKTWNNPALAGPYLLVRNSQEAACYRLTLRSSSI
ncbi:MAG: PQQ-binding-like beta-propeller repeat protein [bacterium]